MEQPRALVARGGRLRAPLDRELEPGRPPVEADREHQPAADANGTEEPGVDETFFVSGRDEKRPSAAALS